MFEKIVKKDAAYLKFVKEKKQTSRETHLELIIVKVGEREIGRLNKKISELKKDVEIEGLSGKLELAEHKTKTALLLNNVKDGARIGLEFMVSPWIEQPKVLGYSSTNNISEDNSKQESNINSKENPPKEASGEKSQNIVIEENIPEQTKPYINIFKAIFSKTTPLQTAVIFILVIIGLGYWGEVSKDQLRLDNTAKESRIKTLAEENKSLKEFEKLHIDSVDSAKKSQLELNSLREKLDVLQSTLGEKEKELSALRISSEEKLESQRKLYEDKFKTEILSNNDAAQQLISEKDSQITEHKDRIASLELSLKINAQELDKLKDTKNNFETNNTLLNDKVARLEKSILSKNKKINELEIIANNYLTLSEFSSNVFYELERFLDKVSRSNLKQSKREFKDRYELWYSKHEDELEAIGVNEL
ncbi:hypothetical protein A7985_08200 [Pseudoalteromonas luteoviolacea]|uniref:Uncharacterized protein n=1 Tax=Pseudoalteromonas luteoviolacea TaxID=43657 RepID=A0A1C0TX84_9GAMM|nr:hypothetical protein [Pseudoalteromonas luteoviolacea]MBQ4810413.1 hypothetical protein [Pseudoalteromonas luteoviolacea]OCQ23907.1 hypothetical protein A7985_08200 [Pseudoalteromonas luteoviolacea]